ncbi:MAG: ABC transporter permease [Bauldia sp.]
MAFGEWRIGSVAALEREIGALSREPRPNASVDLSEVRQLDTAGAWLLQRLAQRLAAGHAEVTWTGVSPEARRLLDAVAEDGSTAQSQAVSRANPFIRLLAGIGAPVAGAGQDISRWTVILGGVVAGLARGIVRPRRLRLTSITHHLDHAAFRAVPINAVIGFAIGIVIAQQGAFAFSDFVGPDIVVVDLTAYLVLREIGVLLAAIMLAGRSGSAITAELGSMKMREEIDALRVIGLDANELLIMPRIVALVIALPLLTILMDITALAGGGILCLIYLDMPIDIYVDRVQLAGTYTIVAGLIKAPFMALAIGLVAASEGCKVRGSSESLGRHTTASVVKSIFMVLLLDAFFAIFFAVIGY